MRLIDIEVDEVSLVDKAANKRSFVMTKREVEVKKDESKEKVETKTEVKEEVKVETKVETVKEYEPTEEDMKMVLAIGEAVKELKASL